MTPVSLLARMSGRDSSGSTRPAILEADGSALSHGDLLDRARSIAQGFVAAGLKPGDRVLFVVRPGIDAILLMIGIYDAGGVLVPLDAAAGPALFASRMKLLQPRWVVAEALLLAASRYSWIVRALGYWGINLPPIATVKDAQIVHVGRSWPGLRMGLSAAGLESVGARTSDSFVPHAVDSDPAFIVFTSGTTGAPKAVVHSKRSCQAVFDTVGDLLNAGPDDVICTHELHVIIPALIAGASVFVSRRAFSAARIVRDSSAFGITHLIAVTAECQQLLQHLQSRRGELPASLREIWIGAAPVHISFLQRLRALLPRRIQVWCVYGMTEILPVARISLDAKIGFEGAGDPVGPCIPGVSAHVSTGGELLVIGPNLFAGYLGGQPCTQHATGDLARLEGDCIVLMGRCKDMIVRGRFNIYPELYEPVVERIEGVKRCAMVGIHDDQLSDERVVLAVEPAHGADARTLAARLWRELRHGTCSIDAAAMPDEIIVMPLPESGRSRKVDKQQIREAVARKMACELR